MAEQLSRRQALGTLLAPLFAAGCSFDELLAPSNRVRPNWAESVNDPISFLAAGDMHTSIGRFHGSRTVASLLRSMPRLPFFAVGDLAGGWGTAEDFAAYMDVWGEFLDRTWAVMGNHDRQADPRARPYYRTFFGLDSDPANDRAGQFGKGYYALTFGTWRIYVLNSEHDSPNYARVSSTGEQVTWLKADLARHRNLNKGAIWHKPRFISTGNNPVGSYHVRHFWDVLQQHKCDWVITGHTHRYERFRRANQTGTANPQGIRQFVVGTGGVKPVNISQLHPLSEKQALAHGLLKMTLLPNRYQWELIDTAGAVLDFGAESSLVKAVV